MSDIETAYNQALDYLYSFVDYSLKHISELAKAEFNLDRMFAVMDELGNPQEKYPILHVAGTKGKGSVAALCASALKAAGYKTGLYTSPHLWDYVERIQINGEPHIATISPEGVKITKKGFRKGNEVTWAAIASGDANLRSDLSRSVDATMTEPGE